MPQSAGSYLQYSGPRNLRVFKDGHDLDTYKQGRELVAAALFCSFKSNSDHWAISTRRA